MNETTIAAFADELEKIGVTIPGINIPTTALKLRHLKYPLMIGGGIGAWEHSKTMKNRYDIGKQVEQQMSERDR
jgi:hypothetical protein